MAKSEVDFSAALKPQVPVVVEVPLEPQVLDLQLPAIVGMALVRGSLAAHEARIVKMLEEARVWEITDDLSLGHAVEMAAEAKKLNKEIEVARTGFIQPALEYQRGVTNLSKGYQDRLATIEIDLKRKITGYQTRVELERLKQQEAARKATEELQKKIDKEAKKAGVEAPQVMAPVIAPAPTTTRTEKGSLSFREVWKFEVTDAKKVPRDYLEISDTLIRNAVKAGIREIPGIKIYSEKVAALRT